MSRLTLIAALIAAFGGQNGQAVAPCDTLGEYMQAYTNCTNFIMVDQVSMNSTEAFKDSIRAKCGGINAFASCMETRYSSCPTNVKELVLNPVNNFKTSSCNGNIMQPGLENQIETMADLHFNQSSQSTCFMHMDMQQCAAHMVFDPFTFYNKSVHDGLPLMRRLYRRMFVCLWRQLRSGGTCPTASVKAMLALTQLSYPIAVLGANDLQANRAPRRGPRVNVAVFGDPHLRVYKKADLRTCSSPGPQVYLENDFIFIKANNSLVSNTSQATVITSLEIEITNKDGILMANYTAKDSQLPTTFDNGQNSIAIDGRAATVTTRKRANLVRIKIPSSGIVIFVSRYQNMYPAVLVRGSEGVFDASSGLLVDDCLDEMSRTVANAGRRKRSVSTCTEACAAQTGQQKEACDFDCVETNDPEFAKQAGDDVAEAETEALEVESEMEDIETTVNNIIGVTEQGSNFNVTEQGSSGAKPLTLSILSLLMVIVIIMHN